MGYMISLIGRIIIIWVLTRGNRRKRR